MCGIYNGVSSDDLTNSEGDLNTKQQINTYGDSFKVGICSTPSPQVNDPACTPQQKAKWLIF